MNTKNKPTYLIFSLLLIFSPFLQSSYSMEDPHAFSREKEKNSVMTFYKLAVPAEEKNNNNIVVYHNLHSHENFETVKRQGLKPYNKHDKNNITSNEFYVGANFPGSSDENLKNCIDFKYKPSLGNPSILPFVAMYVNPDDTYVFSPDPASNQPILLAAHKNNFDNTTKAKEEIQSKVAYKKNNYVKGSLPFDKSNTFWLGVDHIGPSQLMFPEVIKAEIKHDASEFNYNSHGVAHIAYTPSIQYNFA